MIAVGSTQFEELIEAIDCPKFYEILINVGITGLLVQTGKGSYLPSRFPKDDSL